MQTKASSRIPVILSAFVCPGAGQFMQRRWIAGTLFSSGFLAGFIWLMLVAGKIIIDFYRMGFDPGHHPDTPNATAMLRPAGLAMLFYLMSLMDALIAQQRRAHTEREEKFLNEL